jgi:benzodiazapine receptor
VTRTRWFLAAGFLAVVVAYAALSRIWVDTTSAWYLGLDKPWFQPPDVVFGIIWPLNFLALAVVGGLLSRGAPVGDAGRALGVFAVSVVFALGWSYLFSQERELAWSAASLAVAALLTWVLVGLAWRVRPAYGAGLLVYAGWMTLAATLSTSIAWLN